MGSYENGLEVLEQLFAKDTQFALATVNGTEAAVRVVDLYYKDKAFYIVTYGKSNKVTQMQQNPSVALCRQMYRFTGKAYNIGHPLKEENKEIRDSLIEAFKPWYFLHNDEQDPAMCFVKVELSHGFCYKDGTGYDMDFKKETAEEFPFQYEMVEC